MFDFECACGAKFEDLLDPSQRTIECPKCGAAAERVISPVRIDQLRMAASGDGYGTANDYFAKVHRERKAIEDRMYANHGDYGAMAGSDGGTLTPESQADA